MEQKKYPSPQKALWKLNSIRKRSKATAQRVHDNVSLDTDRYESPEDYAETELSEIADDGIQALLNTGRKAMERIKRRIRKQLEKRERKHGKSEPASQAEKPYPLSLLQLSPSLRCSSAPASAYSQLKTLPAASP